MAGETEKIAVGEIFVTSGYPSYTFVPPVVYPKLKNALRQRTGGIVVEGPSGIGKTVAVTRALQEIGPDQAATTLSARDPGARERIEAVAESQPPGTWIIEDFHHLPPSLKTALADSIKLLADQSDPGCKVVLVGINNAGQSLLHGASSDLLTRITIVQFERNPDESVDELINLGEQWLNIQIPDHDRVIAEARGSFLLAQLLCRAACDAAGLTEEHPVNEEPRMLDVELGQVVDGVLEDLGLQFRDVCRRFARGKKPKRAGRAPYLQCLRWLAEGNEWSIQLDRAADLNPRYKGSVIQILRKDFLAEHIGGDPDVVKLIHLSDENFLSVEDPRFVFYLRHIDWAKYRAEIGFGPESSATYDFALSFAAPQRELARGLYDALTAGGFGVFFDEVERDRMLGQDLRSYLAPIYASGAEFVLVILGREYPKRYWTAFEQDQYQGRIDEGTVIPIWSADDSPAFESELTGKGGIQFSSLSPELEELDRAAEDLGRALERRVSAEEPGDQQPLVAPAEGPNPAVVGQSDSTRGGTG